MALRAVLRRLARGDRRLVRQAHRLHSLEGLLPNRARVFLLLVDLGLELLLGDLHRVLALLDGHVVREPHSNRILVLLLRDAVGVRFLLFRHLAPLTHVFRLHQFIFRDVLTFRFSILSFVPPLMYQRNAS